MNLLLFEARELNDDRELMLAGRRHRHLRETLVLVAGDTLRVGQINGPVGSARILETGDHQSRLAVTLTDEPPSPLQLQLVLALPRPKMMRRVLQAVAGLGIKDLHLIHSYRVEKSYWQTPWLTSEQIREQLLLGLEQGGDTRMPRVSLHRRFKPFVEDDLPGLIAGTRALVAHPRGGSPCPSAPNEPITLAVGPEGGFIDYEVDKLVEAGCEPFSLGPRILRVEVAIPYLVARLTA